MSMKCPVCKRAKCVWIDVSLKASTEKIEEVIAHNSAYIEMIFRDQGSEGSSYAEERMWNKLGPYQEELDKRNAGLT
jgi:hypothetical protein